MNQFKLEETSLMLASSHDGDTERAHFAAEHSPASQTTHPFDHSFKVELGGIVVEDPHIVLVTILHS
jgi:hypothetical protein